MYSSQSTVKSLLNESSSHKQASSLIQIDYVLFLSCRFYELIVGDAFVLITQIENCNMESKRNVLGSLKIDFTIYR